MTEKGRKHLREIHLGNKNPMYGKPAWNKKEPIKIICKVCNKIIYVQPSAAKTRKFCSKKCCFSVRKGRTTSLKGAKRPDITGKKNYFFGKHFKGKDNPSWKNGISKSNKDGIYILKPEHPFCTKAGRVKESHLVAEWYLKRYLLPMEIAHHINLNPSDNHPRNLFIFKTQGHHGQFHRYLNKNPILKDFLESNLI